MTKTVIFVGYVRKAQLEYFLRKNYTVGLFRDMHNEDIGELEISQIEDYLDFVFPINFKSQKNVEETLKGVYFKENTILVCLYDRYLLGTSYIAQFLKLRQSENLPVELARNATNKILQRKLFENRYPEITPRFKQIKNFHSAYLFTRKYGFPVIIKPAGLSQSQLVNVCDNLEDLIKKGSYVFDNIARVYEENHVYRTPQVAIEEFLKGKQYSVDSYVDFDGKITHTPICNQTIGYDVGRENFETLYSGYTDDLNTKEKKIIYETVEKAIKAMNIRGNPTHIEVRLMPDNVCKIIEVNLRTGAYRSDLLFHSYGFNHIKNTLNTYIGLDVEVNYELKKHSTSPQFWSETIGEFERVEGIEEVMKLPSYIDHGQQLISKLSKTHEMVGPADFGYPKIVHFILAHESKEQLDKDLKKTFELVKVITRPAKKAQDEE